MERLEGGGLGRQRRVLLPVPGPVARLGAATPSGRAFGLLVVELGGIVVAADLLDPETRQRFHLRLRLHLDPLRSQPHPPPPPQTSAARLSGLWSTLPAELQLLLRLRCASEAKGKARLPTVPGIRDRRGNQPGQRRRPLTSWVGWVRPAWTAHSPRARLWQLAARPSGADCTCPGWG